MKKLFAAVLVLAFMLSGAALAAGESCTGTWYLQTLHFEGQTVSSTVPVADATLKLKSNGSAVLTTETNGDKQTVKGTWTIIDGTGWLNQAFPFEYTDKQLKLYMEEGDLVFARTRQKTPAKASIAQAMVAIPDCVYTGKAIKPKVSVELGETALEKGVDYTLSFKNNKSVGRGVATVTGKGQYSGKVKAWFDILPQNTNIAKLKPGRKKLTVKWGKQPKMIIGYQIEYSQSKNFDDSKVETVSDPSAKSVTIKQLSSGKNYFVRIRTFALSGGMLFFSAWSDARSVTIK